MESFKLLRFFCGSVHTDSLSAMQALKGEKTDNPLIPAWKCGISPLTNKVRNKERN